MVTESGASIHTQFIRSGLNFEPAKPQMWSNHLTTVLSYHLRKYEYIFDNNRIHNWIESISSQNNVPSRWFLDRVRHSRSSMTLHKRSVITMIHQHFNKRRLVYWFSKSEQDQRPWHRPEPCWAERGPQIIRCRSSVVARSGKLLTHYCTVL